MASPPSLPPIESLTTTTDDTTLQSILDTLFEPSPELHVLAIPSLRDELSKQQQQQQQRDPNSSSTSPSPSSSSSSSSFTYTTLINHVGALLSSLPPRDPTLHAILGSHPRLGEKRVASAQSRAEQAQLNTHTTNPTNPTNPTTSTDTAEAKAEVDLPALNAEYEARFPGLRYVVFVGGRGRAAIAEDARRRIARGDAAAEEREIVGAMIAIARDRAGKLGVLAG